jgi:hypothetical protein
MMEMERFGKKANELFLVEGPVIYVIPCYGIGWKHVTGGSLVKSALVIFNKISPLERAKRKKRTPCSRSEIRSEIREISPLERSKAERKGPRAPEAKLGCRSETRQEISCG